MKTLVAILTAAVLFAAPMSHAETRTATPAIGLAPVKTSQICAALKTSQMSCEALSEHSAAKADPVCS
ncbi:hypothetical protein FNB15_07370 [Ferrovibrio terrae]|uniref:DUF2282 domain-containing protein n=1 Tax=Ferrovibrio terrae TaxID=2594003 RepID=A0A516GZZ7_9PROT|nr:hypothetical protein [Ferrovibrio terrae]QDO97104.1 hypothetical protein FNB15_07370 [Ferrovibrio terrae]